MDATGAARSAFNSLVWLCRHALVLSYWEASQSCCCNSAFLWAPMNMNLKQSSVTRKWLTHTWKVCQQWGKLLRVEEVLQGVARQVLGQSMVRAIHCSPQCHSVENQYSAMAAYPINLANPRHFPFRTALRSVYWEVRVPAFPHVNCSHVFINMAEIYIALQIQLSNIVHNVDW